MSPVALPPATVFMPTISVSQSATPTIGYNFTVNGQNVISASGWAQLYGINVLSRTIETASLITGNMDIDNENSWLRLLSAWSKGVNEIETQLNLYRGLGDDWDGEGGVAPSDEVIENSRVVFIKYLNKIPMPEIDATSHGTINFKWQNHRGMANLEIGEEQFGFYVSPQDSSPIFKKGRIDEIPENLSTLIDKKLYTVPIPSSTERASWQITGRYVPIPA